MGLYNSLKLYLVFIHNKNLTCRFSANQERKKRNETSRIVKLILVNYYLFLKTHQCCLGSTCMIFYAILSSSYPIYYIYSYILFYHKLMWHCNMEIRLLTTPSSFSLRSFLVSFIKFCDKITNLGATRTCFDSIQFNLIWWSCGFSETGQTEGGRFYSICGLNWMTERATTSATIAVRVTLQ